MGTGGAEWETAVLKLRANDPAAPQQSETPAAAFDTQFRRKSVAYGLQCVPHLRASSGRFFGFFAATPADSPHSTEPRCQNEKKKFSANCARINQRGSRRIC